MSTMSPYVTISPEPVGSLTFDTVQSVPTAVVKAEEVPFSALGELMDTVFGALFPALASRGVGPAGPAFSMYTSISDGEDPIGDLEVGVPLAEPLFEDVTDGGVTVSPSEIPSGDMATISYLGPYDGLGGAWEKFMADIAESGREAVMPCWEVYVTNPSPESDPSTLRTDLYCLVTGE